MNRRVAINLTAFLVVFLITLWWAVNNIISFEFIERPYQISAEFDTTAGVTNSSEVAYLGVRYGTVRSVKMEDGRVIITMNMDRDKEIPEGSVARIFRKSAVGEPYIDFAPPPDLSEDTPMIQAGAHLVDTEVPVEFSDLLETASRIVAAVDADATQTLIHELAVALGGRGETLRGLTISSDQVLQTFADQAELIDRLTGDSTRLTRIITERRDALTSTITDLADLAESLQAADSDIRVLLDRGTQLLGTAADLVDDVKANLDCVFSDLDDVVDVTSSPSNMALLREILQDFGENMQYLWMSREDMADGVWLRVNILFNPNNPPSAYIPPTQLPAVPEIPPCVSTLSSSGERFAAAVSPEPDRPPSAQLAKTGATMTAALSAFVLGGLAFVLIAHRIRRSRHTTAL